MTLATTHVYNSKYTSLRTYWLINLSCVCPQSSAWSLTLLSLELNQLYARRSYLAAPTLLGNDATVNMGRWLSFSPSLWLVLVFYCCRRSKFSTSTISCIQISNTVVFAWHAGKSVYCCAHAVQWWSEVLVLGECLILRWAWMCMGLAVAGACTKHRPCYWSQTTITFAWPYLVNFCPQMSLCHGYVKFQITLSFTTRDLFFEILDNRFITNVYNFVFSYVHTS